MVSEISFRVFCAPKTTGMYCLIWKERIKQVIQLNNIILPYTQVDIHFKEEI